jgi:hypothetical protein
VGLGPLFLYLYAMNYIKWLLKESLFHVLVFAIGYLIMLFWSPGLDKTIGLYLWSVFFCILLIGKYIDYIEKKDAGHL